MYFSSNEIFYNTASGKFKNKIKIMREMFGGLNYIS